MEATQMGGNFSDLNVLVVDDEAAMTKLIRMMLADFGIKKIFSAEDGKQALEILGELVGIDIVICDWTMPRMSGLELLQQLRTVDHELSFLMLTGRADIDSVKEAMDMGASDYIVKPFSPNVLKRKLTRIARPRAASR